MKITRMMILVMTLLFAASAFAGLDPHFEGFAPYVGKTFEGSFFNTMSGEDAVDVQHWEAILGGKAIKVIFK